jgi:archaeal flagellar protein FlaI
MAESEPKKSPKDKGNVRTSSSSQDDSRVDVANATEQAVDQMPKTKQAQTSKEDPQSPQEGQANRLSTRMTKRKAAVVTAPPPREAGPSPLTAEPKARDVLKGFEATAPEAAPQPLLRSTTAREERRKAKRQKAEERLKKDLEKHAEYVRRISERLGLDPNRPVTEVPALPSAEWSQVEFATVHADTAFIRISFERTRNRYLYEVIEPKLTAAELEILTLIRDTLVRTLESRTRKDDQDAESYLVQAMDQAILDHSILIDEVSKKRVRYYIVRDFIGYGPIDVIMRDPMIEDISCDGPTIPIYLFHRSYESIKTNIVFPEENELDSFVIRLAQRCGKQISVADPLLDATLPDKSRLQASLSKEVTTRGSSFTIRRFRADPLTPTDLCRLGTMSPEMAAFFWFAMEEGASLIYAGGTASGKTSTLNAVSTFIPPQKKIVSIEDTREINLPHENWIAGLTRAGFGGEVVAGKVTGTIDMYKLLEAALRQRPEYLIVGEVRGPEAQTLFQAMATGHATYSTLHGDSVQSAVYRLENPPISVPRIMLQTLGGIAVQIQARVNYRLVRRIKEFVEIVGIDPDSKDLLTNTVFEWDNTNDTYRYQGKSVILERIMEKRNWSNEKIKNEWANRTLILEWMMAKGIRRIDDVVNVISAYYSTPDELMRRVRDQMDKAGPETGGLPRAA